jgi:hypothetical protein
MRLKNIIKRPKKTLRVKSPTTVGFSGYRLGFTLSYATMI